jgi:hypothetical protein
MNQALYANMNNKTKIKKKKKKNQIVREGLFSSKKSDSSEKLFLNT